MPVFTQIIRCAMLLIVQINTVWLLHCWIGTANGEQVVVPLVCPTTYCQCPRNPLDGFDFINFECSINGTKARFKFDPRESTLHFLNKGALSSYLLQSFSGLQSLNLTGLELTELPENIFDGLDNLQMLILDNNNLKHLPPSLWTNKHAIWSIRAENNQLENLALETLPNPTSLRRIMCNGNWLQLTDEVFSNFTKLEWLHLGRNHIQQLPARLLHNLTVLLEFDARSNNITELPENFFSQSIYLTEVYLGNNLLRTLPNTFSVGLLSLRELHLENNKLELITNDVFQQLGRLRSLFLDNNRIRVIESHALEAMKNLESLDLSYNFLDFKNYVPVVRESLKLLNLSHNRITLLDSKTWQQYPCLGDLDLSYNNLEFLQISWLWFIYSCNKTKSSLYYYNKYKNRAATHTEVNLQNNKISVIDMQYTSTSNETDHSSLPTNILISHNPVNCNCELAPLVTFLLSQQEDYFMAPFKFVDNQLFCDKPPILKNEKVAILDKALSSCGKQQCPPGCQCFNQSLPLGYTAQCSGRNFSQIPPNLLYNASTLYLDYNPLDNATGITEWPTLISLHMKSALSAKFMKHLTSDLLPLDSLKALIKLDISNNDIESLDTKIFQGLSELADLDLSYNKLSDLSYGTFSDMKNLRNLFLNHNFLSYLTDRLFEHNNQIAVLQLGSNNLTNVGNVLKNACQLREIYLEHNYLTDIPSDSICFANIEIIVLKHNIISFLASIARTNPNLKKLDLSFNNLTTFNASDFSFIESGTIVNLEHNKISQFFYHPADIKLNHSDSNPVLINLNSNPARCNCETQHFIENLKQRSGSKPTPHIEFLVDGLICARPRQVKGRKVQTMARHEVRCRLKEECPSSCKCFISSSDQMLECKEMPNSVQLNTHYLTLTGGTFESLDKLQLFLWANLTNLKLSLINGSIESLKSSPFQNLNLLKVLTFVNSPLIHTDRKWFQNLHVLLELDLSGDQINVLSGDTFLGTNNLTKINLSHNSISVLPDIVLHGMVGLEILDLSYNQIQTIATAFMRTGQHLRELYLNNNAITSIEYNALTVCKDLILLNLSHNNVGLSDAENLPYSIQKLDLSQNAINGISDYWFTLGNLKSIDLSFTQLRTVNLDDLIKFPLESTVFLRNLSLSRIVWFSNSETNKTNSLSAIKTKIVLDNTSVHCDCHAYPLAKFLSNTSNSYLPVEILAKNLVCSAPNLLQGKLVTLLKTQDLYCPLENCPDSCECYFTAEDHKNVIKCLNSNIDYLNLHYPVQVLILDSSTINRPHELLASTWDNLTELTYRNMSAATHTDLLAALLRNKTKLEYLDISFNGLKTLSQETLNNAPKVQTLIMHSNKLDIIFNSTFDNLLKLQSLDLSFNHFTNFTKTTFLKLNNLRELNLAHNRISLFSQDFLPPDVNLHTLNISFNNIHLLHSNVSFRQLTKLQVMDWSGNYLRTPQKLVPILPISLTTLNISRNNLTNVRFQNWTEFTNLQALDMSDNVINTLHVMDLLFANNSNIIVHLDGNKGISKLNSSSLEQSAHTFNYWEQYLVLTIDHTKLSYDCQIQSYIKEKKLEYNNISFFIMVKLSEPRRNENNEPFCSIAESCSPGCTCYNITNSNTIIMNCTSGNLTHLPTTSPHDVHKLIADNNHITQLVGLDSERWSNITHLSLRHNQIRTLGKSLYPSKLQYLYLDNNQLALPSGWLLDMVLNATSLTFNLTLGTNRWICQCDAETVKFQNWLIENTRRITDIKEVACDSSNEHLLKVQLCPLKWQLFVTLMAIVIIAIMSCLVTAVVLYFRHKAAVHMWLYAHGFCITEEVVDEDKKYDAFISYSSEDTDYVFETLVPKLEDSAPFYKLCIHERDWHTGEQILDQIAWSVEKSRRIIVVLSNNFVRSVWSGLEFQAAHHQSLKDRINRIIIVVLGDLPPNDTLEADLRMHISMNTYLKWDDPHFMDKLRYAMPHKRTTAYKNDAIQLTEIEK